MRNKNYYINLNDREYLDVLSSLMNKRNKLIQSGKYTDGIDEVIMKIKKAKKRTFRVLYSYLRQWQKCSKNVIRKFRNTRNCSVTSFKILTSYSVMQMADRWRAKSSPVHCRN